MAGEPTQETLIFQRHRSLWSLGSHMKSRYLSRHVDYQREDERLSTTITHHLVTGVKAARSQDAAVQSWLLPWDKLQSAECPELQSKSKWISKGQVSPQALVWCRIISALRWCTEMKAERWSFVYKHARDNQVTVGSNFISEFHTLCHRSCTWTFPFANPQPPGLGEMRHHLFTSHFVPTR